MKTPTAFLYAGKPKRLAIVPKDLARTVFRVVPMTDAEGKQWHVQVLGCVICIRETQTDARNFAVELAADLWHGERVLAQVVVHGKGGKIKREYTYGEDPPETKG